jgi:hypothetical protein
MDDNWKIVGDAIAARIAALHVTKAEIIRKSGVSDKTLDGYIEGKPIRRRDKARDLCLALGWTPDSIDRILGGELPREAAPWQLPLASAESQLEADRERLAELEAEQQQQGEDWDHEREILRQHYEERVAVGRLRAEVGGPPRPQGLVNLHGGLGGLRPPGSRTEQLADVLKLFLDPEEQQQLAVLMTANYDSVIEGAFAVAAEGAPEPDKQKVGRRQKRPSPAPEPEGP